MKNVAPPDLAGVHFSARVHIAGAPIDPPRPHLPRPHRSPGEFLLLRMTKLETPADLRGIVVQALSRGHEKIDAQKNGDEAHRFGGPNADSFGQRKRLIVSPVITTHHPDDQATQGDDAGEEEQGSLNLAN